MEIKLFMRIILIHFHVLYALYDHHANCTASEKFVCKNTGGILFNSDANKRLKYATEFGSICNDLSQCSPFLGDNSACNNNVCVCKKGYKWYQGKCRKYAGKGESCSENKLCLDHNNPLSLICSDNICVCNDDYYDRGGDCRRRSQANGDCAISMDCFSTTSSSYCGLGKCSKTSSLGGLLDNNKSIECTSLNAPSKCANGVHSNLPERECLECENTFLFRGEICICLPGFFLFNGQCIAELGMKDASTHFQDESDCPIRPAKLGSDGICYCKEYWFQDETNRECKKTTLEYTKNCMDNDWCKAMGPYAFCDTTTGKCECSSGSSLNETSFYCKQLAKTNICLSDWECPLYESCTDQMCQCDDGFFRVDDGSDLCLPKIGYSCEVRNCDHIERAICNRETAVCECENPNDVNDGYRCLLQVASLNENCLINEQCQGISNSGCLIDVDNATRCLCNNEYKDVNGICYLIRSAGSLCSTQTDCTAILGETFVCRNMLCQCPVNKFVNKDNVCATNATWHHQIDLWLWGLVLGCFLI